MTDILVFDTETTGLPLFREPSDHAKQPHLVQLALVRYYHHSSRVDEMSVLIRPDGWKIPPEMTAIHGISHDRAMDEGIPEADAVLLYGAGVVATGLRVAHNESFDRRIMRIAAVRAGLSADLIKSLEARPHYCTCESAKPIVNLPPTEKMRAAGFNGPKAPKLEECIRHFFDEPLDGAHDALVDARACGRLYFHLKSLKEAAQ